MINHYPEIESEINKIANRIQTVITEKHNSDFDLVLATLFKRIINGYNSINLLLTNGFNLEALTVMRSGIETRIVMTSFIKDPDKTFEKLRSLTDRNTKKYIKWARKLVPDYNKINIEHLDDGKGTSINDFFDIDKDSNQFIYEFDYSKLCNIVHINKRSLEIMLVEIDDKITLRENISIHDVQQFYDSYVAEVTKTFMQIYQQFKIEKDEPLQKLNDLSLILLNINL